MTGSTDGAPLTVLHVNDVASVGSVAVAAARAEGLPWRLWPLPPVRGRSLPAKAWVRGVDLARFRAAARGADVLHVHFAHFAYYAWSVGAPYLLHLHGTDIRDNVRRRGLGPLTRAAIRRAGAVVYSTPDLADAVHELRPDAVWLPAPIRTRATGTRIPRPAHCHAAQSDAGSAVGHADLQPVDIGTDGRPGRAPSVVFASRWDPVKGLDRLLAAARDVRRRAPGADLVGVDWGSGAAAAAAAGVRLVPKLTRDGFRALLAGADVVVGQLASGALGVTDLEAMALGVPVVAYFTQQQAYGGDAPLWNAAVLDPADAVVEILSDPEAARCRHPDAAAWAQRHHGAEAFIRAALPLYARVWRQSGRRR